jgi:hypothetical protein
VRCRKTNFRISVIRLIDQGIDHFSLCAARHWTSGLRPFIAFDRDGGDDHLRLTGYGYSCSGIDARSNEKPYSTNLHGVEVNCGTRRSTISLNRTRAEWH